MAFIVLCQNVFFFFFSRTECAIHRKMQVRCLTSCILIFFWGGKKGNDIFAIFLARKVSWVTRHNPARSDLVVLSVFDMTFGCTRVSSYRELKVPPNACFQSIIFHPSWQQTGLSIKQHS